MVKYEYYIYSQTCQQRPPREKQNMVFIDKWSVFGGFFILFYQGRVVEVFFTGWSLFRGGL